ncbi:MAG: DUF2007 domain-containing protein [Chloroflexi bacterium]|nr:DUF2007 domain-containing protein [Chloroflexota bacterium]
MFRSTRPRRPGLTLVYTSQGMLPAQVIKTKLEAAGIPALLEYESAGQAIGITMDGLGEVHVFVPDDFADDARRVLDVQGPPDEDEIGVQD